MERFQVIHKILTYNLHNLFKAYKIFFIIFFLYIKMTNKYYQKHKEKLLKAAHEKYQYLSEEGKDKRGKNARDRY